MDEVIFVGFFLLLPFSIKLIAVWCEVEEHRPSTRRGDVVEIGLFIERLYRGFDVAGRCAGADKGLELILAS